MPVGLDLARGELIVGGSRFGAGTSLAALSAAARQAGVKLDPVPDLDDYVTARAAIGTRTGEVEISGWAGNLAYVELRCDDHPEGEHEALQTLRDRRFVRSILGEATYEHGRGAMYALDWGWLYTICGKILFAYPGSRSPVPMPTPGVELAPMRCCGCGLLEDLGYPGVQRAGPNRGTVPCKSCGTASWVRAYSFTEFYAFKQRPWVCEVGMHPAEGIRRFKLVFPEPDPVQSGPRLEALFVKACPEHVDQLADMFAGATVHPAE